MADKFLMPKLSPTMEEGQIARWLKKEGESFKNGETLAEVDTDKATMEMTALTDGVVLKILKGDGETVPLGDPIAITGKEGEDISALLAEIGGGNGASVAKPAETKTEPQSSTQAQQTGAPISEKPEVAEAAGRSYDAQRPGAEQQGQVASQQTESKPSEGGNGRLIVSPIAARMAAEAGLNLNNLQGSGPGGRIIKRDIEAAIAGQKAAPQAQPEAQPQIREQAPTAPGFQQAEIAGASAYREEPTTQMRRAIASRLTESIGPIPTFYLTIEVEMDKAIDFRKQINAALPEEKKVSINDVIIKTVASALMRHPQVNASYQDRSIRYYERADIGVAVAIPDGLITPIIRNANGKGIAQIAAEVKELAGRARDKKLKPEEFTGGTFSISNLGMFGIEEFTAIINPPEAGILAIGKSEPKPVVRDGEIVVRNMMRVTMSCDHRVIDGATGAQFLKTLKQMLENPMLMLM
ncbi:MAG TPA: pyruvate dehydrogenase complex dihydrolipoamide acetyltransferase [Pyrinomonadaceae bacterium]|jgi:pyruvate dehydrogenase E2 component (dihydrolipoamide acetyltransferase)